MVLRLRKLQKRVNLIEQKLEEEQKSQEEGTKTEPKQSEKEKISFSQRGERKGPSRKSSETSPEKETPTTGEQIVEWIKEDWILKIGALFLLIGFGWLTTYAFLNDWIGPKGRIALGIISGVLILILGWWRIKKYLRQGSVFLVLGSTVNLITIFAARGVYGFFTPISGLAVVFLSTAFVALASVKYKSRALSVASLVLAAAAPLFTSPPSPYNYTALFGYLLIVILGTIWVAALTKQRKLTTIGLIVVSIYSVPHLLSSSVVAANLLPFAYGFAALFFITNTLGILKNKKEEMKADLVTAAGNGLFLLSWITSAVQKEWQSLTIAAWMIVFTTGAFIIFKITRKKKPFFVYSGVGVAMLAAATSAELSGPTLTIAYTLEAGAITVLTYFFLRKIRTVLKVSFLLVGPVLLSLESISSTAWEKGVIHNDFFVLLVLVFTFIGLGLYFWTKRSRGKKQEIVQFSTSTLTIGTIYIYILIWQSSHAWFALQDVATMLSLVIYTLVGLFTYFRAAFRGGRALKTYGAGLLIFVVGRLLLIDVWGMGLTGRIITFFSIGVLFVSTAFLTPKSSNKSSRRENGK